MERKTIWLNSSRPDTYAEFVGNFSVEEVDGIYINVGCDGHVVVYINGKLAFFGASADYPWHRIYYKTNISAYCDLKNEMRIIVWHPGVHSQTYIKGEAGLVFCVEQEGKVLLESGSHILSRQDVCYKNEYCKLITGQLGLSYYYDNTVKNEMPFLPSVESAEEKVFHLRKTGYLKLGDRLPVSYHKTDYGYLVDMKEENVGFLELDFESPVEQELVIAYGEHLVDGQVARFIGERDFSVEFKACKGENQYLNPFRRLAGRYLQVFCDKPLNIRYIGLRPTDMEIKKKERRFSDALLQQIYDVSVNTLTKCMHEHYEDCPWREQAMYILDSRNQMLCGYYVFEGTEYAKENILFIKEGQREDGLMSLCFPAGIDIPIPFFSLAYILQIYDYVKYTKNQELAFQLRPVLDKIREGFQERVEANGLIANLPYPYWNFYEWSEGSHNEQDARRGAGEMYVKQYDLMLNCMYVYFCQLYEELYGETVLDTRMLTAIQDTFWNETRGLYKLSTNGEQYSQLGNSLAILIGIGSEEIAEKIVSDTSMIEITLSMNTFYYDALLSFGEKYKEFIIDDIKKKYGYMLEQGATTFWETAKGWQDFEGAGSLCHGWSAIPAYYIPVLIGEK